MSETPVLPKGLRARLGNPHSSEPAGLENDDKCMLTIDYAGDLQIGGAAFGTEAGAMAFKFL